MTHRGWLAPSPAPAGEGRGEGAVHPPRRKPRPCPCRAVRLALLGLAAAVAAWAAFGQAPPKPSSPFGAAAQKATAAASAVAARAASATAVATSAAASVAAAASGVSATASKAVAAAASAAALPDAAASAVRAAAGALLAVPASAPAATATSAATAAPAGSAVARAASDAAAAASTPCVQASDGSTFCAAPPLQLVFKTVALPAGRLGAAYGPRLIVRGGTPPYALKVLDGKLPAGLALSDDGQLAGLPTAAGLYRFTLAVRDAASPPLHVQQPYALRIEVPPKPQAAASAPAPAASATLTAVSREDAEAVAAQFNANQLRIYQLAAADVDKLLEPPGAAASDAAADTPLPQDPPPAGPSPVARDVPEVPAEPGPTPEQLQDMLKPLIDVGYATQGLFEQALEMQRCAYYGTLVQEAAHRQGVAPASAACPPAKAAASGASGPAPSAAPPAASTASQAAGGDAVPLNELYTRLLPPGLKAQIVSAALKRHDLTQAQPVQWAGNGCGCVPERPANEVYGFFPFWLAQGAEQAIDFSQFTRIGYFGGVLNDTGRYTLPPHWDSQEPGFSRMAHRHGVALDLVVYRRQWTRVLNMNPTQQDLFARQAATEALALVDTPLTDWFSRIKPVVMPFWGEQLRLYGGLTVFFDNLPTERTQADRFRTFYKRYVGHLIAEMQRSGRRYALNLVMPDHLVGEEGAFNFQDLLGYVESAERATDNKAIEGSPKLDYHGTTDIRVHFLVLLGEPTSVRKKALRARIDNTDVIQGHKRVAFLNSLVPVLFYAGTGKPAPMPPQQRKQMDDDLAYLEWQFGGAGYWPVPVKDAGMSADVSQLLVHNNFLGLNNSSLKDVCGQVCVNRSALRLLFNVLLVIGLASLGAYALSCQVRRLGIKYLLYLWAGGIATLLVGIALLSCDPHLAPLRGRNYLLYALIAVGVVAGVYLTMKPKEDPP